MAASSSDLITQATVNSRPVPTTVSSTRSAAGTTLSCLALSGWATATKVHFATYKINTSGAKIAGSQCDWTGIVSGTSLTNLVLKAGTDIGNVVGDVVEAGPTAAYANDIYSGVTKNHDSQGNHVTLTDTNGNETIRTVTTASAVNDISVTNAATGNSPVISATGDDSNVGLTLTPKGTGAIKMTSNYDAWVSGLTTFNTVTYNGNRSYTCVINSTDYTDRLSPGMRLRTTRTVAAPTQCTSLNGTTQYYSKSSPAGMTFTNNFVVSAWVKLTSYGTTNTIASRYDGTSGWELRIDTTGVVSMWGYNGGSSNTFSSTSYQSVPLNKWVHIAAQMDASTTSTGGTNNYIMLDGVEIPNACARGGTNPTSILQGGGSLNIGARNGAQFFPGKIAQVAIFNAKVTEATIQGYISQGLAGTETSLISAYSFNNSINDLNANANNLTPQGSAVATNADSPFGGQASGLISSTLDYGIITSASFSTNTTLVVQVPEGCTIPTSGGVSAVSYSTQKVPYGMPIDKNKWRINSLLKTSTTTTSNATYGSFSSGGYALVVPIGAWEVGNRGCFLNPTTTTVYWNISSTALTGLTSVTSANTSPFTITTKSSAASYYSITAVVSQPQSLSATATYVMYTLGATASAQTDSDATNEIFAELNLL